MLAATIFTSACVSVPIAFWSTRYSIVLPNVGRVKSSVDDLIMERGTVSMRVALVLRSAEVRPLVPGFVRCCLGRLHACEHPVSCVAASSPPPLLNRCRTRGNPTCRTSRSAADTRAPSQNPARSPNPRPVRSPDGTPARWGVLRPLALRTVRVTPYS